MPPRAATRRHWFSLLSVVLLGLAFRLWGFFWGLQDATVARRPHPDEWVVYWIFRWFDSQHSLNPCPSIAGHRCFFDWGAVYLYVAYLIHLVLGLPLSRLPPHSFGLHADPVFVGTLIEGRFTAALASAATIVLVFFLGRRLYGLSTGLLAALVLALVGLLIQLAHFATPDSFVVLSTTAALLASAYFVQTPTLRAAVTSGVTVGIAVGVEYHMVLLAVPLAVAWTLKRRPRGGDLAIALGSAVLVFCVLNPYALIQFRDFAASIQHTFLTRTVGREKWYQGRFSRYQPDWLYVVRYPLGYGAGVFATVWMAAGFVWSLIRHRDADILLLSWIVPYGVLVSIAPEKFMRYSVPLVPALTVLAAGFAVEMWSTHHRWRRVIGAFVAASLLYSTLNDFAYVSLFARPDARYLTTNWLRKEASAGSRVMFEQLPDGLLNVPYFVTAAGFRPCFALFQSEALASGPGYLVTDAYSSEQHPTIPSPRVGRFYAALSAGRYYRTAFHIHPVPGAFGLTFPIDGSPHDWRYPSHDVTVYRRLKSASKPPTRCYGNLSNALKALYVPLDPTTP